MGLLKTIGLITGGIATFWTATNTIAYLEVKNTLGKLGEAPSEAPRAEATAEAIKIATKGITYGVLLYGAKKSAINYIYEHHGKVKKTPEYINNTKKEKNQDEKTN